MSETIGSFDAKQRLSELLSRTERGEDFVITRHGMPVGRLVPYEVKPDREAAKRALFERLRSQKTVNAGRWTRAELYERDSGEET